MVTVSRRVLLSLLALILVPPVFSVLAPNPIQAGETPSFLLATAAATERFSPPVTWLDDLERRLTTYFTKKYPAYDFSSYAQELDRIRGAVSLGDRWGAKREMGVFLTCWRFVPMVRGTMRPRSWLCFRNESCRTRSSALSIPDREKSRKRKEVAPEIAVNVRTSEGGSDHDLAYTRH